jgi:hypothetical protein
LPIVKHAPERWNQRLVVTVLARDNEHVDVGFAMGALPPRARAIQPHRVEVVAVGLLDRGHKPTEELALFPLIQGSVGQDRHVRHRTTAEGCRRRLLLLSGVPNPNAAGTNHR